MFYGDKNNWWATYAFWVFKLFGFENARMLDGGRIKWEAGGPRARRPTCRNFRRRTTRRPQRNDAKIRAFSDEALAHVEGEEAAGRRALAR